MSEGDELGEELKDRVVIAMSGGVDSSVAAALLADEGYDTVGISMRLYSTPQEDFSKSCCSPDDLFDARMVADRLGIDDFAAGVLPEQKSDIVRKYQQLGKRVAMAGDGINDSPALAAADVGIAMGDGTDIAMESAGVTLIGGDLRGIVRARRLSEATVRNIRQNLFFAFVYNGAGVPVAAGALYPAFGLLLSPMLAAAAMSLSSVSVIANALRLGRFRA